MAYQQQKVWLWARDCFKILPLIVIQRIARVCQRQLSYLLHLALPFILYVAGNSRHFELNMWVEHSMSQHTDDTTSLKWAWPRHVTYFKLLGPLRYFWNGLIKARDFKSGVRVDHSEDKLSLKGAWSRHVTHFKFLAPP